MSKHNLRNKQMAESVGVMNGYPTLSPTQKSEARLTGTSCTPTCIDAKQAKKNYDDSNNLINCLNTSKNIETFSRGFTFTPVGGTGTIKYMGEAEKPDGGKCSYKGQGPQYVGPNLCSMGTTGKFTVKGDAQEFFVSVCDFVQDFSDLKIVIPLCSDFITEDEQVGATTCLGSRDFPLPL